MEKTYNVKITGSGTKDEILKSLTNILEGVKDIDDDFIGEDPYLMCEIEVEE